MQGAFEEEEQLAEVVEQLLSEKAVLNDCGLLELVLLGLDLALDLDLPFISAFPGLEFTVFLTISVLLAFGRIFVNLVEIITIIQKVLKGH